MLLKGNFILLRSLGLSQSNSLSGRKYLQNGEKLGRIQQQLRFLSTCAHEGLFPKSISNMKIPGSLNDARFSRSKDTILRFTLGKLRRAIFSERAKIMREWEHLKIDLSTQLRNQQDVYERIIDARGKAYITAYNHHGRIIDTKIINLRGSTTNQVMNNVTPPERETMTERDVLVT